MSEKGKALAFAAVILLAIVVIASCRQGNLKAGVASMMPRKIAAALGIEKTCTAVCDPNNSMHNANECLKKCRGACGGCLGACTPGCLMYDESKCQASCPRVAAMRR